MAKTAKPTLETLEQRIIVLETAIKANTDTVSVELPASEDIDDLKEKDVISLCTSLAIKTEGKKPKALKALLKTVAKIGESEKVTEDEVNALCKALAIKPGKKLAESLKALKEYLNSADEADEDDDDDDDDDDEDEKPKSKKDKKSKKDDDDDEDEDDDDDDSDEDDDDSDDDDDDSDSDDDEDDDSDDDDDTDDSDDDDDDDDSDDDDDEEEKKSSKKSSKKSAKDDDDEDDDDDDSDEDEDSDEEDDDEVDSAAVVEKLKKLPKEAVMKKHLDQFAKADPKAAKKFKGSIEDKYRSLLELLVTAEGEIAKWGEAYVKDSEGYCCGLPLKDTKVKGEKGEFGKCVVTGTVFKFDDGEFTEVK